MVDLDYFRAINDNFGHAAGDKIILEVVKLYNKGLNENHIMARYGGDEFTIVMMKTSQAEAIAIAEKIRTTVEELGASKNVDGKAIKVTLSQGIASYPDNADDLKTLREKADQALYKAKEEGRNRTVCAD